MGRRRDRKKTYKKLVKTTHKKNTMKRNKKHSTNNKKQRDSKNNKKNIFFPKIKKGGGMIKTLKPVPFLPPGGGLSNSAPTDGKLYYNQNLYGNKTPGFLYTEMNRMNVTTPGQTGGSIVPQDIVSLYRSAVGNIIGGVNTLQAKPTVDSIKYPLAYEQPALAHNVNIEYNPPNVDGILKNSFSQAAKL